MRQPKIDPLEFPPREQVPAAVSESVEPYGFALEFERLVVATAITCPRFWGRLAGALAIDGFRNAGVRLVLTAVAAIHRDLGQGPSSVATVLQRLKAQHEDGKLSRDELREARQVIVEAFDGGELVPEAEVLGEMVPVLRRRMQQRALDEGYKALVSRADLDGVGELLDRAKRLGKIEEARPGVLVDPSGFELIRRMSRLVRMPTSIPELDDELKGGVREGEYWLFAGGYASGKSMALNQVFGSMLVQRVNAAMATLELSEDLQYARLVANLVGYPIDDLLDDMMAPGEDRLFQLCERNLLGHGSIRHFPPDATTVQDLKAWVLAEQDRIGAPIEGLVVDYADKLGGPDQKQKKDEADKAIAEGLRGLMDRSLHPDLCLRWVWSATQIKASAHDRKRTTVVEGHHAADSIHKARVSDGIWTLNPRDDGESILYHLTKNRTGVGGAKVGPLPVEYPMGRIAAVERPDWPF